jgi:hypothetical protein
MIIWGWSGREIKEDSGRFYCPDCDSKKPYVQYRVATYFTLYFIPLFETQYHGSYVQCCRCNSQYSEAVLDYKPLSRSEKLLENVRAELESGKPLQMVMMKLTNEGIKRELAAEIISLAVEGKQVHCEACDLDYLKGTRNCAACGEKLK